MSAPFDSRLSSRREFLRIAAGGTAAVLLGGWHPAFGKTRPDRELLFFAAEARYAKDGMTSLCVFDTGDRSFFEIAIPVELAHDAIADPHRPEWVAVLEQDGPRACMVNVITREVRPFPANPGGQNYYGHAIFLPDHGFFITSEIDPAGKQGRLAIRRVDNLKVVDLIATPAGFPHDMRLIESGTKLVTANGHLTIKEDSLSSSLSYHELSSRKLLHMCHVKDPGCFATHLEVCANGDLIVPLRRVKHKTDSKSRPAALSAIDYLDAPVYWVRDGKVLSRNEPAELKGLKSNSLSICLASQLNMLGLTHAQSGAVSFWSASTHELLKVVSFAGERPKSLTFSQRMKKFVVGLPTGFKLVDPVTFAVEATNSPPSKALIPDARWSEPSRLRRAPSPAAIPAREG